MAIPAPVNPESDHTGAYCAVGQSGPVWNLLTNMGGSDVRTCTVPAGKALLISPVLWESSVAELDGTTFAALRSCAKGHMDGTEADVTVDGVHLANLPTRYRFQTPLFTFKYPADNVFRLPGPGTTKSVTDGIFVMLAPLAAGRHTIDLSYFGQGSGEVTYHLTIRR